jgi:hypothetical protein
MTIVPETRKGKISFYQTHVPKWAEDPASIGVTPEAVATLADLVSEARDAYTAHSQAQQTAQAATQRFHDAVQRMHRGIGGGANLLQQIKTFAAITGDKEVYVRAWISAPARPGRPGSAAAPGMPHGFEVELLQIGWAKLTWKCDNPRGSVGTVYEIRRQLNNQGTFHYIATVGSEKRFIDQSLPTGTHTCIYEVTALRSTRRGKPARYMFNLSGLPSAQTSQPKGHQALAA